VAGTLPYSGSVMLFRAGTTTGRDNNGNIAIDFSKAIGNSSPGVGYGSVVQYDFQCDLYITPSFQSWRNQVSFSYYSLGGPFGYSTVNSGTSTTWFPVDDLNVYLTTTPSASIVQIMQNINPQGLLTCNHSTVEFESQ
jgi:hypothetical protein